ncbi:MAG: hypothetical protein NTX50_19885, partial [Candidatus Sumerlaeota bacterium]|nr:hypothetical protein [Candidatus Sumerlaeota bacterium]
MNNLLKHDQYKTCFEITIKCIFAFVLLAVSSCSSAYWVNRSNDAEDIFTLVVGIGGGCKARVGPIATGLGLNYNRIGIQNGYYLSESSWHDEGEGFESGLGEEFHILIIGGEQTASANEVVKRKKQYRLVYFLLPMDFFPPEWKGE